jgi:CheY-specific phosphatase CheX
VSESGIQALVEHCGRSGSGLDGIEVEAALSRSASMVLATLCEASAWPASGTHCFDDAICSVIPFSGGKPGVFHFIISTTAALVVARSFLGIREEIVLKPEVVDAVCCEVGNIICGSVLSALHAQSRIELHCPVVSSGREERAGARRFQRVFEMEQGRLEVSLSYATLQ